MTREISRRQFVCRAVPASAAAAFGLSLEERTLLAQEAKPTPPAPPPPAGEPLPTGTLGKLAVSRLILGGNLIGGWAHSRDLLYVSDLMKRYFTDAKILDTLQLAESHGINMINIHPSAHAILRRYWKERGGKMQCMAQGYLGEDGNIEGLKNSVDQGAHAIHIQGNVADTLVAKGKLDVLAKGLDFIRSQGIPAGVAGHLIDVPRACEEARLNADFYMKTLHTNNYFSSKRPYQKDDIVNNRADNFWCVNAEETVEYMKKVEKPWIAFKVMAAGAIRPSQAFPYAFNSGADFITAGIFDFQIADDVRYARNALAKVERARPWRS